MQCTIAYTGSQGLGVHEVWRVIPWSKVDFEAFFASVSKRDAAYMQHTCVRCPRMNCSLSLFAVGDDSFQV
jgi:hypothetical protein